MSPFDGVGRVSDDQLYRAMDTLVTCSERLQEPVFFSVGHRLNLEVDVHPRARRPGRESPAAHKAWAETDDARALEQLCVLPARARAHTPGGGRARYARARKRRSPHAARGPRPVERTSESTNRCASMIEIVRRTQRNVQHRSSTALSEGLHITRLNALSAAK